MRPASQRPNFFAMRRGVPGRREHIVALYKNGLSMAEIAQRLGISSGNVAMALKAAGVQTRSIAEGKKLRAERDARKERIAAAAQRVFGHLKAPEQPALPPELPPVNDLFVDDAFDAWEEGL
jgi:transposase-like protein